jgi:hypothetical protein
VTIRLEEVHYGELGFIVRDEPVFYEWLNGWKTGTGFYAVELSIHDCIDLELSE